MPKKKKQADEGADAAAPAEGGKKKKVVLLAAVVIVVAVLGGGAVAGGFLGGGGDDAEAAATEPAATPTPSELGMVVQLESVTLNLQGGHFLKLGVAVELGPDVAEEPPTAPIYDALIEHFSPLTIEALSDQATREATKGQLLTALAEVYGSDVVGIYYTEFVMQ